jgi:hypothetical protein
MSVQMYLDLNIAFNLMTRTISSSIMHCQGL